MRDSCLLPPGRAAIVLPIGATLRRRATGGEMSWDAARLYTVLRGAGVPECIFCSCVRGTINEGRALEGSEGKREGQQNPGGAHDASKLC